MQTLIFPHINDSGRRHPPSFPTKKKTRKYVERTCIAGYEEHIMNVLLRMSDAGDDIQVDAPVEVEAVATEAPKGKMSVEDALQVCNDRPRVVESY